MRVSVAALGVVLVCSLAFAADESPVETANVARLLPASLAGWTAESETKTFTKDTIFNHINGEAEIFFPYGFAAAATANYTSAQAEGLRVQADVYEMGSPLDAFGIYSNYRYPQLDFIEIGCEGYVSTTQLVFYQDCFLVKLTASDAGDDTRDRLKALATAIQKLMPAPPVCPDALTMLQIEDVIPKTESYIADSVLGYGFFPKGFVAKVKLHDSDGRVFLVTLPTADDAEAAMAEYRAFLGENTSPPVAVTTEGFEYETGNDPLYKNVLFTRAGAYVFGVVEATNPDGALDVLRRLHAHLERTANTEP
jgi:hypothetical protein